MSKHIKSIIVVLALAALVVPVYATAAKVTKATGKDAAVLQPAVDVFPGSVYDNAYQIPGGKGKVNMIQPNGNVDVIIAVCAEGLEADSQYTVYFDRNGITAGDASTAGPWSLVGEFWTDEYDCGEWNYTAPAGSLAVGDYTYSVFINRTNPNATVLIGENVEFAIAEE